MQIMIVLFLTALMGCEGRDSGALRHHDTARLFAPMRTLAPIAVYPHDPGAFTQGLVIDQEGWIYESTGNPKRQGLSTRSEIRKVDLKSGRVRVSRGLPETDFGEGLALRDGRLYQLTWKGRRGRVLDAVRLTTVGEFTYETEGWGLAYDGAHFVMSDGSDTLFFRDPQTFHVMRRLQVKDGPSPVRGLNELEVVEGEVLANVWPTDRMARISLQTGEVLEWFDLGKLLNDVDARSAGPANGIAYWKGKLFVTGKGWPKMYVLPWKKRLKAVRLD